MPAARNSATFERLGLCPIQSRNDLTCEHVRELFKYSILTGKLYWRVRLNSNTYIDDEAGTPTHDGYYAVAISQFKFARHRIVWMWAHGPLDDFMQIDHINRVRGDDRLFNLRTATDSQNKLNAGLRKDNKSGYRGVFYRKDLRKWCAQTMVNRQVHYLGFYHTAEEANQARLLAVRQLRPADQSFLPL